MKTTEAQIKSATRALVAAARHAATEWAKLTETVADHDRRLVAHRASCRHGGDLDKCE